MWAAMMMHVCGGIDSSSAYSSHSSYELNFSVKNYGLLKKCFKKWIWLPKIEFIAYVYILL